MKITWVRSTVVAFTMFIAAGSALAAPVSFEIDASHSEAEFTIRHFFSKVRGGFDDIQGKIVYDAENVAAGSVEVTIPDSTINTGNVNRDKHLRTEDFFWVEKFPTITFKSTKVIPGADANHFKVEGDLTMRGVTKPVVLDAELLGMGPVAMGGRDMGMRAGFQATTKVNRKDFEIVWNRNLDQGGAMLGDDVDISLAVEGKSKPAEAPAGAKPAAAAPEKKK